MVLSIIVPCYNEEDSLPLFFEALDKIESQINETFEYIFVNDGSRDKTLEILRHLHETHLDKVTYLSFSRNFGKEAALYAGLKQSSGDYVTVMDADLQDPPEMLVEMLQLIQDGQYDCIGTRRVTRKGEPPIRTFFAKCFYKLINRITDTEIVDGARDFRLMTRQMVDAILELTEYNRFSKGIFSWVGFDTLYLPYENRERVAGTSSWSFWSLFKYSIEGIVNFSDAPLVLASFIGMISCLIAVVVAIIIVIRTLWFGDPTSGWPSMVVIILFMGGLQLLCLGIVGKYIGKVFLETKHRPLYIIKEEKKHD